MLLKQRDKTNISFGKLSDPGVLQITPLANDQPELEYFTNSNFQYIVDNIADMFGLGRGTIQATVVEQDYRQQWTDRNEDGVADDDEIMIQFTMNANIQIYKRESSYGKHFMYYQAHTYGYPVIFGIVAHEVGHLMCHYVMHQLSTQFIGQARYLVEIQRMDDRWAELCSDYLAGVILAKSNPRLSHESLKNYLARTVADAAHPDGFWRTYAVEMGYQWGCYNPPAVTSQIISDKQSLQQLLVSFYQAYYQQVFCAVDPHTRGKYSNLSPYMMEQCCNVIAEL